MGLVRPLLLFLSLVFVAQSLVIKPKASVEYTSEWAVHLHDGIDPAFLKDHGYEIVGPVSSFDDVYVVRHIETHTRHEQAFHLRANPSLDVTSLLTSHPHVKWAEQQLLVQKHKRDFVDPLFSAQWHLINTGQFNGRAGVDVNIQEAWDMGFNGDGVRIAIVDDGFQTTHPDLSVHYQAGSSYSFNAPVGNSPNPDVTKDFHGSSAAGVAMAANNSVCGVGAAFMAEGAGIRMISARITDTTEASGLTYMNQLNDIYSNSWGPSDDGVDVGGPSTLSKRALQTGVTNGRDGLGSIFVWAAGNGGAVNDNCNYDGYSASRETIAVGAIGNDGTQSYYSESCAALLVVAPSNSANAQAGIRTTDLLNANGYDPTSCTPSFGGTSSACPLVAGVIALMLQANPKLTWRDVPYILATTSSKTDRSDPDWVENAAGYLVNHKYGFGLVDATAAVKASLTHINLPASQTITTGTVTVSKGIPDFPSKTGVSSTVTVDKDILIEKVIITLTINHPTSGDLEIVLVSPSGTESVLATPHATTPALFVGNNGFELASATFGAEVTFNAVTGRIVTTTPQDACTALTNCNAVNGAIAFVYSSPNCRFTTMAKNVQNCKAKAFVLINNDPEDPDAYINMGGTDSSITIPCVSVSYTVGRAQTVGSSATIVMSQIEANSYKNGWNMLSARLLGESSKGKWTVKVTDGFPGSTGTFNSYAISIYGITPNKDYSTIGNPNPNNNGDVPSDPDSNNEHKSEGLSSGGAAAISIVLIALGGGASAAAYYYIKHGNIFGFSLRKGEQGGQYVKYVESNL